MKNKFTQEDNNDVTIESKEDLILLALFKSLDETSKKHLLNFLKSISD